MRDKYTRILVWASTPVPVASEPRRDQDVDLRSRWHSMLEKLEICHRDRRFVECGDVCNKLQDLVVFIVNLVKTTADLRQAENETVSKMTLTNSGNCVNQTAKNKQGLSPNGTDLRPGKNSKYPRLTAFVVAALVARASPHQRRR